MYENINFIEYKTCQHARYKSNCGRAWTLIAYKKLRYFLMTYMLERLFMSSKTAEHMTWHHSYDEVDIVIMHPFNG
jgi:hypothetical protein